MPRTGSSQALGARCCLIWGCILIAAARGGEGEPPEPLQDLIDRLWAEEEGAPLAEPCDDATFLRRVTLNLWGMPASPSELKEFLTSGDPDKRGKAVDRLLADPRHARHFARALDLMLMERRASPQVSTEAWQAYLLEAARQNRPLNELFREILAADGYRAPRAAANFYLARSGEPTLIVRDVGRVFFGRDLQCAQCHDHPLVDDYLQRDFQSLLAVFAAGSLVTRKEGDNEVAYYGERLGEDLVYASVFIKGEKHAAGPQLPGVVDLGEPILLPGADGAVVDADAFPPQPAFSRRAEFARRATDGSNAPFNENLANRLWAYMMGRGLVQPVDWSHAGNAPARPELLRALGARFAATGFDARAFLRGLALSRVYQRGECVPPTVHTSLEHLRQRVAVLEERKVQLERAREKAEERFNAAHQAWREAEQTMLPLLEAFQTQRDQLSKAQAKLKEASAARETAAKLQRGRGEAAELLARGKEALRQALERLGEDAVVAESIARLDERTSSLQAELEKLAQDLAKRDQELAAAREVETAARSAAQASAAALEPARSLSLQREASVAEAREVARRHSIEVEHLRHILDTIELDRAWMDLQRQIADAQAQITLLGDQIAATREEMEESARSIARLELAHQSAQDRCAACTSDVQRAQQVIATVSQNAARLRQAADLIHSVRSAEAKPSLLDAPIAALDAKLSELDRMGDDAVTHAEDLLCQQQAAEREAARVRATLDAARNALQGVAQRLAKLQQARDEQDARAGALQRQSDEAWGSLVEAWSNDFVAAALTHLPAEDIAWSILRATGLYDQTWQSEVQADAQREQPKQEVADGEDAPSADPAHVEQKVYEKLQEAAAEVARLFAPQAGQPQSDFFATVDQALFLANGGSLRSWLEPAGENLTARAMRAASQEEMAEELFLSILNRFPTKEEVEDVVAYLATCGGERDAAIRELAWSLIASVEFRFNR